MKMMKWSALGCAPLSVLLLFAPALADERHTSSIKPEDCVLYDLFEQGASTACQGLGGYSLAIVDADARIYISILHATWAAPAKINLNKITRGSFSSLPGDAVEWLGPKEAPSKLVVRLGYAQGDGRPGEEASAVIRLDQSSHQTTCLVAWIPKDADAVEAARAITDASTSCL